VDVGARNDPAPQFFRGRLGSGEQIILATDAFAEWLLRTAQRGQAPWAQLGDALVSEQHFADFIATLRGAGDLRNDDVAVASVRLSELSGS
jgi:hypothetical protein